VEIHKPKPAHTVREFLIEIGTIICGILIALALEQVVEGIHRRAEVREAREALQDEIRDNASTLVFGVEEDKCLLPKLDAFAAWARGGPKPPALRTFLAGYGVSTWETVKISAVPHMPLEERRTLAAFYDHLANEKDVVNIQRSSALVLIGASERDTLDHEDARRVLDAVSNARLLTNFHISNAQGLIQQAEKLGVKAPPLPPEQQSDIALLCEPGANGPH
jgi:hypothetical protein